MILYSMDYITIIIFGLVALLAIPLGITLYRVVPCWLKGESRETNGEQPR